MLQSDVWSLLCRGRRKKTVMLIIVLIILINAMFYVTFQLYNMKNNREHQIKIGQSWPIGEHDKSSMRVIVGHYVGGLGKGNLSDEIIHSNNYAPVKGAGEGGRPVQLSQRELITARELYPLHFYNIFVGDKISINRSLPDMRIDSCKSVEYNLDNLPTATVIIVFHNEAWSTLMRTVMSVISRSPQLLLKQIILVDDASDRKYLGQELDEAVANLDKVKILRIAERKGIVGARLLGARNASGDVLVFLDAHCEVTQGWLEPLLDRAGSDDVFICPTIDILSEDTLGYTKIITTQWGAFNWHLHFRWFWPSDEVLSQIALNPSKPYLTPAMAGGLFAVRASLFWRLGGYDEGMRIWGAENIELSWRAWQCGARIEITRCSRVGHMFRRNSPYKYTDGLVDFFDSNLARAATVWMDEWTDFFFKFSPHVGRLRKQHTVYSRVELRKNLKCRSFKWYLDNVWPQHFFPTDERWFGRIRSDRGPCLVSTYDANTYSAVPATGLSCSREDINLNDMVVYTPEGKIMANENVCLEQGTDLVIWKNCKDNPKQIWQQKGPRLKSKDGLCLTIRLPAQGSLRSDIITERCSETTKQIWHFERVPWR